MIQNTIPWPNGARCACAITFDIDADSLIHISRPENSHQRLYPISMGRYGPDSAIPRILDTYRRLGIKQSFYVPAWCLETYAPTMEAILSDGHEIGHHGLIHEDPIATLGSEQEEAFEKALEIHKSICGLMPRGYRAPLYNLTPQVVDLLIKHRFTYETSLMGSDIPYVLETDEGKVLEMPVHWGCDDWPQFAHYEEIGYMMPVRAPSDALRIFREEFEGQYKAGGFFILIVHPFLTGRLARWLLVEEWLEDILKTKKVWFAPLEEIAAYVQGLINCGDYSPKTDQIPYYKDPIKI